MKVAIWVGAGCVVLLLGFLAVSAGVIFYLTSIGAKPVRAGEPSYEFRLLASRTFYRDIEKGREVRAVAGLYEHLLGETISDDEVRRWRQPGGKEAMLAFLFHRKFTPRELAEWDKAYEQSNREVAQHEEEERAKKEDEAKKEAEMRRIEVIDLPANWKPSAEDTRKQAEEEAARLDTILKAVESGEYAGDRDLELLKAKSGPVKERFHRFLKAATDDKMEEAVRVAETLDNMGDPAGMDFLLKTISSGSADARQQAMESAQIYIIKHPPAVEARIVAILLAQLTQAGGELPRKAIGDLAMIDGTGPQVWAALAQRPPDLRLLAASVGSAEPASAELAQAYAALALQHLDDTEGDRAARARETLIRLAGETKLTPPETRAEAAAAVDTFVKGIKPPDRYDQTKVQVLAPAVTMSSLPYLNDIFKNAPDVISRGYALEAMARLRGEAALDQVLVHAGDHQYDSAVASSVAALITPENSARVVPHLAEVAAKLSYPPQLIKALWEKGGEAGRNFLAENAAAMKPKERGYLLWLQQGWTTKSFFDAAIAAGLVDRQPTEKEIGEVREEWSHDSDYEMLPRVLGAMKKLVLINPDLDVIPVPHDALIRDLGTITGGKFHPTQVRQTWIHPDGDPEKWDADDQRYDLEFVDGAHLIRFKARYFSESYDSESVARTLNRAQEVAGRPERFVRWEDKEDADSYVFGDPEKWKQLLTQFGYTVATDKEAPPAQSEVPPGDGLRPIKE